MSMMPLLVEAVRLINRFEVDHWQKPTQISMSLETRDAIVAESARMGNTFIPTIIPPPSPDDRLAGLTIVIEDDLPYAAFVVEGDI